MAYLTLLASVAEADVDAFRQNPTIELHPSLVSGASHLLSYWVKAQPLGQLLNEAIDGGEVLHDSLWHPLRSPLFHRPPKVRSLAGQINAAWDLAKAEIPKDDGGWLAGKMSRLLRVYLYAATAGEGIVTALDIPGDEERSKQVRIPWGMAPPLTEPGKHRWKFWPRSVPCPRLCTSMRGRGVPRLGFLLHPSLASVRRALGVAH